MKRKYLLILLFLFTTNLLYPQDIKDTTYSTNIDSVKKTNNTAPSKNARLNSRDQINKYDSCSIRPYDKSYVLRLGLNDTNENIEFYGISLAAIQNNFNSIFNGITINGVMGEVEFNKDLTQPPNCISVNGINFSLIGSSVSGTINGIGFGGLVVQNAAKVNGISFALMGTITSNLNGLALAIINITESGNGIQFGIIANGYQKFNGFGFAAINSGKEYNSDINGIVFGLLNVGINVRGISLAVLNGGNCWLQIGLINGGDSIVQIGILNLDENGKLGIPFINVNL